MKKYKLALLALLAVSVAAIADTNSVPTIPLEGIPTSKEAIWSYAISAITPVLVWLLSKLVPVIPKPVLPMVTPVIGIGLGFALNALAGTQLGWVDMAKAGAMAVAIREIVNQAITKQVNGEQPWQQSAAKDAAAIALPTQPAK